MGRFTGKAITRPPIQLRPATMRVGIKWLLLAWLGRMLGRLLAGMVRHPWVTLGVAVLVGMQVSMSVYGTTVTVVPLFVLGVLLVVWRLRWPDSFAKRVGWPVVAAVRQAWVYRRGWEPAMTTCGLVERYNDRQFLPTLRRVKRAGTVDRVTVRMLPGQVLDDYAEQGERLAMTFGARDCRVVTGKRHGEVDLCLLAVDPLERTVPPIPPEDVPDLAALPVALREDGSLFRLRLHGNHVLLAGSTGAGKSGAVWAIIHALSPAIRSGLVQLWGIDPKGGMEFAMNQDLFARHCYGEITTETVQDESGGREKKKTVPASYAHSFADLLEDAVRVMQERQARYRGVVRLHTPSTAEPLIVVLVDELAALTAYVNDRDAKRRIREALQMLLSQGRAVGVTVMAALQDPRKEVLPFRDLFPFRIALRLTEKEQVDMTLGDGFRARGARCDRIPTGLRGVAYVIEDGVPEPIRIRFPYLTDDDIRTLGDRPDQPAPLVVRPLEGGEAA